MKWFFERWKKYKALAAIVAVLSGSTGVVVYNAIDGASAVHDAARAELGKAPVADPEQEQGAND